jgi:hypothetical protein
MPCVIVIFSPYKILSVFDFQNEPKILEAKKNGA